METLSDLVQRMDMSSMDMDMDNSTTASSMSTAFTTSLGASNLWFSGWTPTSRAATAGACIGLVFLAIFSRLLVAVKACSEAAYAQAACRERAASAAGPPSYEKAPVDSPSLAKGGSLSPPSLSSSTAASTSSPSTPSALALVKGPLSPAFRLAIDTPRAILLGLQAFVGYLLMLAVMSFSVPFFVSILAGLMVATRLLHRPTSSLDRHNVPPRLKQLAPIRRSHLDLIIAPSLVRLSTVAKDGEHRRSMLRWLVL